MGFSITGFIIASVIFAPNLLFFRFPPKDAPEGLKDAGIVFVILERAGQAGCLVLLSILKDNFSGLTLNVWFVLLIICIIAYYCLWIRYIVLGYAFALLFQPLVGIPVPMAIFPVLAFAFAAVLGRSVWLGVAVILLAIGHFVNSWKTYKQLKNMNK
jgi:hypothetical protein